MVTVVRAFLLPTWDVRVVFPQTLDGVRGRGHGTAITVSVLIRNAVRWWWSEEWEVGSRTSEMWYLSTRGVLGVCERWIFDCLIRISSPDN